MELDRETQTENITPAEFLDRLGSANKKMLSFWLSEEGVGIVEEMIKNERWLPLVFLSHALLIDLPQDEEMKKWVSRKKERKRAYEELKNLLMGMCPWCVAFALRLDEDKRKLFFEALE